ncbi:hypothetical protein CDAR_305901 [Caerostris darwini]|uniref:Uncharacterized protein n=1 Tax=Caerostris darwini TaxID=1538125 RepID=A0AAV4VS86_9ARAC|nr:hypothetical protein CDAR_305901 [Caerostris darwini]
MRRCDSDRHAVYKFGPRWHDGRRDVLFLATVTQQHSSLPGFKPQNTIRLNSEIGGGPSIDPQQRSLLLTSTVICSRINVCPIDKNKQKNSSMHHIFAAEPLSLCKRDVGPHNNRDFIREY